MKKMLTKVFIAVAAIALTATSCKKDKTIDGPQVEVSFSVNENLQTVKMDNNGRATNAVSSTDYPSNWTHVKGGDYNVIIKWIAQSAGAVSGQTTCKYKDLGTLRITVNAGVYKFTLNPVDEIVISKDALYRGESPSYDIDANFGGQVGNTPGQKVVFDCIPEPMVLIHPSGLFNTTVPNPANPQTNFPFIVKTDVSGNPLQPVDIEGFYKRTFEGKEYYYGYVSSKCPYSMTYIENAVSNGFQPQLPAGWQWNSSEVDLLALLRESPTTYKPMSTKTVYYLVKKNEGNFAFASIEQPFNDLIRIDY